MSTQITIMSRIAHKKPVRVWRLNINGKYHWFDSIAKAYRATLPYIKAKRAV